MLCLLSEYISESDCQHELDQPTVLFVSILKRWIWMWSDLLETEIHSWTFTDKRFNMYSRKQLHFQIHFLLSLVDMLMCNILDSRYFRTWGDFRSHLGRTWMRRCAREKGSVAYHSPVHLGIVKPSSVWVSFPCGFGVGVILTITLLVLWLEFYWCPRLQSRICGYTLWLNWFPLWSTLFLKLLVDSGLQCLTYLCQIRINPCCATVSVHIALRPASVLIVGTDATCAELISVDISCHAIQWPYVWTISCSASCFSDRWCWFSVLCNASRCGGDDRSWNA